MGCCTRKEDYKMNSPKRGSNKNKWDHQPEQFLEWIITHIKVTECNLTSLKKKKSKSKQKLKNRFLLHYQKQKDTKKTFPSFSYIQYLLSAYTVYIAFQCLQH